MTERARILIFTGEGKGKTTAAMGMALRASGHGKRVFIVQFIKQAATGEAEAISGIENIKIVQAGLGFLPDENSEKFADHKLGSVNGLNIAAEAIESGQYNLVVLDEVCVAVDKDLLEEKDVIAALGKAGAEMCVVMTGRGASSGLIEIADTVSRIDCVKHGYENGIKSQKGVEF